MASLTHTYINSSIDGIFFFFCTFPLPCFKYLVFIAEIGHEGIMKFEVIHKNVSNVASPHFLFLPLLAHGRKDGIRSEGSES